MQRNSLHRGISDVTLVGRRIAKNYKILREVGGALKKSLKSLYFLQQNCKGHTRPHTIVSTYRIKEEHSGSRCKIQSDSSCFQ